MKKIIVLGLVAIMLASSLVLVSCGGCIGDGKCNIDPDNFANASWCGEGITDPDDAKTVMECAVYKESLNAITGTFKKAECDC